MSCNWPVVKTGDIFELINGYAFKSLDFTADGAAVLKIKNIKAGKLNLDNLAFVDTSFLSKKPDKIVLRDDLLITMSGNRHDGSMETWVGKVCWFGLSTNYMVNQRVGILRLKKNINANPRFLAYQLSSVEFQHHFIAVATSSGGQANLSPTQIKSTELFLPPRQVQDAVAKVLGELEDKIKVNNQLNQTLEQIAQAIFKSWFVDFEPVKAKIKALEVGGSDEGALLAAMQAISGKDKTQLTQLQTEHPEHYNQLRTTAELFPSAMQDSELGEIPEGWNYGLLSDISQLNKSSWTKRTFPSEIEYVDLANTKNGIIENTSRYAANEAPSRARRKLSKGDTIIGTVRPGNRSYAFIYDDSNMLTGSTGFAVLTPENRDFAEFLYIKATSEQSIDYLAHLADGGAYPAVRPEVVSSVPSILPSDALVRRFHHTVSPYFKSIGENNKESSLLTKVKLALLPKLLSGEILMAHANESQEVD